jgi:hypothetical protein
MIGLMKFTVVLLDWSFVILSFSPSAPTTHSHDALLDSKGGLTAQFEMSQAIYISESALLETILVVSWIEGIAYGQWLHALISRTNISSRTTNVASHTSLLKSLELDYYWVYWSSAIITLVYMVSPPSSVHLSIHPFI